MPMASMPSLKAVTPVSSPNVSRSNSLRKTPNTISSNYIQLDNNNDIEDDNDNDNDNIEIIVESNRVNNIYSNKNPHTLDNRIIEDSTTKTSALPLFARQTSDVLREYREHNNNNNNNMTSISLRNRIGTNRPRSSGIYKNSGIKAQHSFVNNNNNNEIEDDHRYKYDEQRSHSLPPLYRKVDNNTMQKRKVTKIML